MKSVVPDTTTQDSGQSSGDEGLELLASAAVSSSPLQHQAVTSALQPPSSHPLLASSLARPPVAALAVALDAKDPGYWEKRRRNNEAARKSREKRRLNDLAMEERVRLLAQQNDVLKSALSLPPQPPPMEPVLPPTAPLPPINTGLPSFPPPPPPFGPFGLLGASPFLAKPQLLHHFAAYSQALSALGGGAFGAPEPMGPVGRGLSAFEPPTKRPALSTSSGDSASPDSTLLDLSQMDGKGQLRQKILERQRASLEAPAPVGVIQRAGKVGACLSTLAVSLDGGESGPSTEGSSTSSAVHSESSDGGSQPSPGSSGPRSPRAVLASQNHGSEGGKRGDPERYSERRRRNNEAAKRCRANRRMLYEYRFKRAEELETENGRLKEEMSTLSRELASLKQLLSAKHQSVE